MLAYTIRRLLTSIPILAVASFIVFWLVSISADPVQEKYGARNPPVPRAVFDTEYRRLGLTDGFFQQYWNWLKGLVVHGDFGPSINQTTHINAEISGRLGTTLRLIFIAMLLALILAVATGVFSAIRQYSKMDYTLTFVGFLFLSMPPFWAAALRDPGLADAGRVLRGRRQPRRRPALRRTGPADPLCVRAADRRGSAGRRPARLDIEQGPYKDLLVWRTMRYRR